MNCEFQMTNQSVRRVARGIRHLQFEIQNSEFAKC